MNSILQFTNSMLAGEEEVQASEAAVEAVVDVDENNTAGDDSDANHHEEKVAEIPPASSSRPAMSFHDHYTLQIPSSAVRFRGSSIQVAELRSSQLQLARSEAHPETILLKNVPNDKKTGLNLLRLAYTLVCFFYAGFLFLFCFQLLLYLFMDLVVDSGLTDAEGSASKFIGTLLSIPIFLYGLASAMTCAGAFVVDVWNGHVLLKQLGGWNVLYTEWLAFTLLLGIPLLSWIIILFSRSENWWRITLLVWFCTVTVYYVLFSFILMFYELEAAWLILQHLHSNNSSDDNDNDDSKVGAGSTSSRGILTNMEFLARAIQHRQQHQYSAHTTSVQMTASNHQGASATAPSSNNNPKDEPVVVDTQDEDLPEGPTLEIHHVVTPEISVWNIWAKLTMMQCCQSRVFNSLENPRRIYSLNDVLDSRQFVTANSWSLEKVFCSNQRLQSVTIVRGPSALRPEQMASSFWCSIAGILLVILLCAAGLAWMESGAVSIALFSVLVIMCCLPRIFSTKRVYEMYQQVREHANQEDADSPEHDDEVDAIYQTYETYRVSQPSNSFGWVMFVLEIGILFLWPMIVLFTIRTYVIAVFFFILGVISMVRYYLNPCVLIQETGSIKAISKYQAYASAWKAKARLFNILKNVTRGPSRAFWIYIFLGIAFVVILMAMGALTESAEDAISDADEIVLLPKGDFVYPPQPNLPYPTCALAKGLGVPNSNSSALADYAFLAVMAYQPPDTFQEKLDLWFGDGVAKDEVELTQEFRKQVSGGNAAVSYHLVSFSNNQGDQLAVVVVRGSTTSWEWMTDAQLWSGAAIAQIVRGILPMGEVFTPIIHQLLNGVSFLESDSLEEVALYQQTTQFVRLVQQSGLYKAVHITGQSLGGGISLITAAQTGIPGIAISGPNNMLSRETFSPAFTRDDITQFLFNVIPERDIVPRIDDVGMQHQEIRCRAKKNDLFGCHSSIRSLCEIIYTCGSSNRPPLCECATKFGYPEAMFVQGNQSYTDVCGTCRTNDGYYSECEG